MKHIFLIFVIVLFSSKPSFSIGVDTLIVDKESIEYIDNDNILDSIYFNFQNQTMVFLLSSSDYKPMVIEIEKMLDDATKNSINIFKGGIEFTSSTMRTDASSTWIYEEATGKFRLSHLHKDYHGPLEHSTIECDCLTNEFTGSWSYYDPAVDSLVTLPTVDLHLYNPAVYLNDSIIDYYIPSEEFLQSYKDANVPSVTYTGRFNTFTYEGGEHYNLSMKMPDGLEYNNLVGCNYEQIYRGDSINVTEGTTFYSEPGEGEHYYARVMITDIQLLEPGEIRLFHETNKKEIDYHPNTDFYTRDAWENRIEDGIVYFLAQTSHKPVRKSLKKQGKMDIYISDYQQENPQIDTEGISFLVEIFNTFNGKTETICRFVMEMCSAEEIRYDIVDEKIKV